MAMERPNLDPGQGLSEAEAQVRLGSEGYNELPRPDRRTPLRILLEVLREPMLALLLGGGLIYLALGDFKEAVILAVFATLSIGVTVVQEARTERVLEALRDLTSPRALVIRDGDSPHPVRKAAVDLISDRRLHVTTRLCVIEREVYCFPRQSNIPREVSVRSSIILFQRSIFAV